MNKVYKTKWNAALKQHVAVSERATNRGKVSRKALIASFAVLLMGATTGAAYAATVTKTDADASNNVITVTEAELNQVGGVGNNKGVDVIATGNNSIVIEGGVADISTNGAGNVTGISAFINGATSTGNIIIGEASKPLGGQITTHTTTNAAQGFGIEARHSGVGGITIYTSADITTLGRSRGIYAEVSNTSSQGDIVIESSSNITLHGAINPFAAIQVENYGSGNVYMTSSGNLIGVTGNNNKNGVYATSHNLGNINMGYTGDGTIKAITGTITSVQGGWNVLATHNGIGDINVQVGDGAVFKVGTDIGTEDANIRAAYGGTQTSNIFINVGKADLLQNNDGAVVTGSIEAEHQGISGSITINSEATVNTTGNKSSGIYAHNTQAGNNINTSITHKGAIAVSGEDSSGIHVDSLAGAATVVNSGLVQGGKGAGAGVTLTSTTSAQDLTNQGTIGALNDIAIASTANTGTSVTVQNDGTITGYMTYADGDVNFTNNSSNSWNLRNFVDANNDGVRDTKAVAISNFGAGTSTFTNTASGTLRLNAVSGETTIDTTGEYVPVGALSSATAGIVHGQLINLNTFNNAGLIDLSHNSVAGDVLVITGGATAGTNGGGRYISNGGSLKLDTLLNQGGTQSLSDVLVVDNVSMGTGATKIIVTPTAGSAGALTTEDGIKVVEVLGTQDAGSFALSGPLTYGAYEYILGNGITPTTANNWYLRNTLMGKPLPNPDAGSVISNQNINSMIFDSNVLRDSGQGIAGFNLDRPEETLWAKVNYSDIKGNIGDGLKTDLDMTLLQVGADLYKKEGFLAGVYAGYGTADQDTKSTITGSKSSGEVDGYQIGIYGSWKPEQVDGLYIDAWGYYAWFDNTLKPTNHLSNNVDYDSTGYSVAAEVGYAIKIAEQSNSNNWYIQPNARLGYVSVDADNFYDLGSQTRYSDVKSSGVQTRLGARIYSDAAKNNIGWAGTSPYAEVNWIHNGVKSQTTMNNLSTMDNKFGEDVGEVKVGVRSRVTERLSLGGYVGMQRGSDDFKRNELGVGLSWDF